MILPNGCYCSDPTVNPPNLENTGASIQIAWYIQYYFHNLTYKEKYKNGKLFIVKGHQSFKNLVRKKRSSKNYFK